jgi:hypothetical protein
MQIQYSLHRKKHPKLFCRFKINGIILLHQIQRLGVLCFLAFYLHIDVFAYTEVDVRESACTHFYVRMYRRLTLHVGQSNTACRKA